MQTIFTIPTFTHAELAIAASRDSWIAGALPDLTVSRDLIDSEFQGTLSHYHAFMTAEGMPYVVPAFHKPPVVATKSHLRAAVAAVRNSPGFIWEDVKSAPLVSAGILAGLCAASFAGVMDTVGPWIFAAGAATATWMTAKGGLGIAREAGSDDAAELQKASRDFGMGVFSFATMATASGFLYGMRHFGILAETGDGQIDGAVQAFASLLHSSDEIALGVIMIRKFFGGTPKALP